MKRTMKDVMLDKMTTQYLGKKGLVIADMKALPKDELLELGLPLVIRDHIAKMNEHTTAQSVAREIARMGHESTATASPIVPYTDEQQAIIEKEVISEVVSQFVDEVIKEEVVEVKEEVLVDEPQKVEVPAYTEDALRALIESIELSANYTTVIKRVKAVMDASYEYNAEMLITLAKEYAASVKK